MGWILREFERSGRSRGARVKGHWLIIGCSFNALPEGDVRDPEAYKTAIAKLPKGSAVISTFPFLQPSPPPTPPDPLTPVFTPDSTHYPIAKLALESGHHVMVTKPATQLLEHHQELASLAASKGLVCWVEQ